MAAFGGVGIDFGLSTELECRQLWRKRVSTWSDLDAAFGVFRGGALGIFFLSRFSSDSRGLTSVIFRGV